MGASHSVELNTVRAVWRASARLVYNTCSVWRRTRTLMGVAHCGCARCRNSIAVLSSVFSSTSRSLPEADARESLRGRGVPSRLCIAPDALAQCARVWRKDCKWRLPR